MVKAKFGDSLRSKTDIAMVNESLCKILCHNLCCLVLSTYELGITATFWEREDEPAAETVGVGSAAETFDPIEALAWI